VAGAPPAPHPAATVACSRVARHAGWQLPRALCRLRAPPHPPPARRPAPPPHRPTPRPAAAEPPPLPRGGALAPGGTADTTRHPPAPSMPTATAARVPMAPPPGCARARRRLPARAAQPADPSVGGGRSPPRRAVAAARAGDAAAGTRSAVDHRHYGSRCRCCCRCRCRRRRGRRCRHLLRRHTVRHPSATCAELLWPPTRRTPPPRATHGLADRTAGPSRPPLTVRGSPAATTATAGVVREATYAAQQPVGRHSWRSGGGREGGGGGGWNRRHHPPVRDWVSADAAPRATPMAARLRASLSRPVSPAPARPAVAAAAQSTDRHTTVELHAKTLYC